MEDTAILDGTEDIHPEPATDEPDGAQRGPAGAGRFLLRALWDIVSTIVPAIFIALFINVFVAQAMVVEGPSMQPNLYYNQRVMVEKVTYRFLHSPRRGDVVIVNVPGEDEPLIKRVVAVASETVEVRDGQVYIDGEPLEEPWPTRHGGPSYPATLVPPLHVFVLGDNRGSSRDSRSFGPVSLEQIVGRAWLIYWPLAQARTIH